MTRVPREKTLDSTLALLSEGYTFIPRRCRRYQSDIFETRLMFRKAYCTVGEGAARMFYHPDRFTRKGALPPTTLRLLLDRGSVQQLDGGAHHWRKQMFMALMSREAIQRLLDIMSFHWHAHVQKWASMDEVILLHEVRGVLCRAVCEWAGIPLDVKEAQQRTREFAAMIDGAGAVGPRNWWGALMRERNERWMRNIIDRVRAGRIIPPQGSALHVIASHRDLNGELLDRKVAAVELINVLRPTVAVARFVTFAALALHEHPHVRTKLQDDAYLEWFVQEVRRYYPFFPAVGGRARTAFTWRGQHFPEGSWVLLDLYGTNRDPRSWQEPESFTPERFRNWNESAFNFIPQGGGDYYAGHRCAGEWITIELMKRAVQLLTTTMRYRVPKQDLRIDLSRMPAVPKSRFVLEQVTPIR